MEHCEWCKRDMPVACTVTRHPVVGCPEPGRWTNSTLDRLIVTSTLMHAALNDAEREKYRDTIAAWREARDAAERALKD